MNLSRIEGLNLIRIIAKEKYARAIINSDENKKRVKGKDSKRNKGSSILNIQRMGLDAFHLKQKTTRIKNITQTIKEYICLIWLINEKRQKCTRT